MNTLHTPHCTLEPQVEAHAQEMYEVLCDPAIYEFERSPPPSVERLAAGFRRQEARVSPDGLEQWLNWVVRLPGGEAAGYVQATVLPTGAAYVAYELASAHWRRGIGSAAVRAMLDELATHYRVHTFVAVLKAANHRSLGLLVHLGFAHASSAEGRAYEAEADEIVMLKPVVGTLPVFPLTAADATRYRALMLQAYTQDADAYTSTAEDREKEPMSWWARRIADPEGLAVAFGVEIDQQLVGTVALEYTSKPKMRHTGLLIGMYVREAARNQGVGRSLLRAALDHARRRAGIERLTLNVTEGNRPAIDLYRSVGFTAWGTEPMAIRTPSGYRGKVHMSLALSPQHWTGPQPASS